MMFACIVEIVRIQEDDSGNEISRKTVRVRSSWFNSANKQKALMYAQSMAGVVALEQIGKGIIWERSKANET